MIDFSKCSNSVAINLVTVGLLKNVRLLRRCASSNDKRFVLSSLRAIQRIARQSQMLLWNFCEKQN